MLDVVTLVNEGIDEMDVHLDTTTPLSNAAAANAVASTFGQNGLLASIVPKPDKPCDDYDADWFCAAHPSSFPHNTGRCPKGTSLDFYCKTLLNRYPISQFAQNLPLIADSLNILQRHAVNTHAWVQFRCSPDKCNALANLTEADVQVCVDALRTGAFGDGLKNMLGTTCLPTAARTLYNGVKAVGGNICGTPQSFLKLRSKVLAPHIVFGHYTISMNLCPSELGSEWTFKMADAEYTFDADGYPEGRPHLTACRRIVAANPVACAEFFRAYMSGFLAVFCGWPIDSDRQCDPDCMMGELLALYLKYENGTRGGLHSHGQGIQPALQANRLKVIMSDGDAVQRSLFSFFENVMCSFFPEPATGLAPPTAPSPPCTVQVPRGANGEQCATAETI